MTSKRDIELLYELGTLRFVDRTWRQFLSPEFANVADHMFRVAWIALLIARREGNNNHEKILKMALVHDVPEGRTGDANAVQKEYTERDEERAAHDLFADTSLQDEMVALWKEVEERKTAEAQIVKDADYLDQLLELKEQEFKGSTFHASIKETWHKVYGQKLFTKTGRAMLAEIEESNVLDWFFSARGHKK